MPYTKFTVGLTGGIGSGKTTVAKLFAQHGITVIDTDFLARELTRPSTQAFQEIIKKFGPSIVKKNGHLDRKLMREIIFNDAEMRIWLENLLHPLIYEEMKRQIAAATSPYCIAIIPLLFEKAPAPDIIQRVLVVDAPEELQIKRTAARDLHSQLEVEAIMKTQVSREQRLNGADDIIVNDKGPENLIPQVDRLNNDYLAMSSKS